MPDALEIIKHVSAQHLKVTEHLDATGQRMNDIDAVFSVQVAAYKTAQSSFPVTNLVNKRDELLHTIDLLGDGLKRHFAYEEKVLPLVFGDLLMKNILHDHGQILDRIEDARNGFTGIEQLSQDELLSRRSGLLESINNLSDTVVNHAHYEEQVLDMTRKAFEVKRDNLD